MAEWYVCFKCHKVTLLFEGAERRCPTCHDPAGEVISQEWLNEGRDRGAYFNVDLRTGKRAKPSRRMR